MTCDARLPSSAMSWSASTISPSAASPFFSSRMVACAFVMIPASGW